MASDYKIDRKTKCIENASFEDVDFNALIEAGEPVILKGVLRESPLCKAADTSAKSAMDLILSYYNQRPVIHFKAEAEIKGRFFYNDTLDGFNYRTDRVRLEEIFEQILAEPHGPAHYVGSADVGDFFPNLIDGSKLQFPQNISGARQPMISLWMGNQTTTACHYDMSNNIAACMVGKRRFTLFPPSQIANLYPGPLEPTPGGQVVSMVNFKEPDLERFPHFPLAIKEGQIADLDVGDVLVYPAMWWHQVEALEPFNVLLNYWWNNVPAYLDDPVNVMLQGILSLRDRPEHERQAWRHVLDYYVFNGPEAPIAHLPEHIQNMLAPLEEQSARRLRAKIIHKLNR
ncbi:cupin-like domain-containing protein [Hirschia litorea]|uniref:Cupin-like domain-containing protein n=1 Tax=Hirschia litorea TaxID=1199156 RepID=A0ABW2INK7_9PROT